MAEKIVGVYDIKVDEALNSLNKLSARVDKLDKNNQKAAKNTEKSYSNMASNLTSQFKNLAGAIGLAFGVQEVIRMGKEMVTLAAQTEGVERAFKRIGGANADNLLKGLREATRGTVSDLQLMQKAVQASNFKIPLENLASLFKFAQARARETGESVEYLTNSIVLGIGRKSPLILDNLGISAVELRSRLKGVGVEAANVGDIAQIIGDIATEELAKMGDQADTTADAIARLGATMQNLKAEGGEIFILLLEDMAKAYDFLTGQLSKKQEINALNEAFKEGSRLAQNTIKNIEEQTEKEAVRQRLIERALTQAEALYDAEQKNIEAAREAIEVGDFRGAAGLKRLKELKEQIAASDELSETYAAQIDVFAKYIEMLELAGDGQEDNVRSITLLSKQLKELKNDLNNAEVGSSDFFKILDDVTAKTKELNDAIALTKLEDALKVDEEEDIDLSNVQAFVDEEVAIRSDGSERIQQINDENLQSALDAIDAEQKAKDDALEKDRQRQEAQRQLAIDTIYAVSSIVGSIAQIQSNLVQEEIQQLDLLLEQGEISREEYDQRRRSLLREQAETQKAAAIFQATIDGAVAVVTAFKDGGPILAALVGATVAAQVAAIASQPLPQFAEGGFVNEHGEIKGRKHISGGVRLEAEGGEYITAAKYAQPNAEILMAINSGQWEKYKVENIIAPAIEQVLDGGFDNIGASMSLQNNFNDRNLLKAIDRHRASDKDGFVYLAKEIKRMNPRKRGGFA